MQDLANCARCGDVFVKTLRPICPSCYKEEEEAFDLVYRFLRKQKNREATIPEIVDATGVEEQLIIKFVKEKRLRTSQFPKLAYPCERCNELITTGKLCVNCTDDIKRDLERHEHIEQRKAEREEEERQRSNIYYSIDKHIKE